MTVWIVTYIDSEDNPHQDIYEEWEIAWYVYGKMWKKYGEDNVWIREFKEVRVDESAYESND